MAVDADLGSPWASTVPPQAAPGRFALPPDRPPRAALGGWWRRVAAALADSLVGLLVLAPALGLAALAGALSSGLSLALAVVGYLLLLAVHVWQLVRQGRTGATYGKELLGLRLVGAAQGQPVGVGASLARPFVHLVDALPLSLGYLWPLWDGQRQTFTDKALSTLVVRVPRRRPPMPVAALAVALAALMTAGSVVALADEAPDADEALPVATDAAAPTVPTAPMEPGATPAPPAAPPVVEQVPGPLPVEDTAGRIAPAAPGYTAVSDEVSELGSLDALETAALGGGTQEEISLTSKQLLSLGFVGAYGRGFDSPLNAYAVLAYRFSTPGGATRFMDELRTLYDTGIPTSVPGGVISGPTEDSNALAGYFTRGSYVYEVSIFGAEGSFGTPELNSLLAQQRYHVDVTG